MLIKNLKIQFKLGAAFIIMIALLLTIAVSSNINMNDVNYQIEIYGETAKGNVTMALARVEQVRFELNSSQETANEVYTYLGASKEAASKVHKMAKSDKNRENAQNMLKAIEAFETDFTNYSTASEKKIASNTVRVEAAKNVLESLDESLEKQQNQIQTAESEEQIQQDFNEYVRLKEIKDNYNEIRVLAKMYVDKETREYADGIRNDITQIQNEISTLTANAAYADIEQSLEQIQENLAIYKSHFEEYDALVLEQQSIQEDMRQHAREASDFSDTIVEGVNSYINNLEDSTREFSLILVSIAVIMAIGIAIVITQSIRRPLNRLMGSINSIKNYQLTDDIPQDLMRRKDEMGELAHAIADIRESLRTIIIDIAGSSQQLTYNSDGLNDIAQITSNSSHEIAKAIDEIANGATDQAQSAEDGSQAVQQLTDAINQNADVTGALVKAAQNVNQLKGEGQDIVKGLIVESEKSSKVTDEVSRIVSETNTSASQIVAASQMIQTLSEQTNLLALNAAIEAARAGESGRGFTVVADEVRKLAEQTSTFSKEIENSIEELVAKAGQAVTMMDESKKAVSRQITSVQQTQQKFDGITLAVDDMEELIQRISESSDAMEVQQRQLEGIIENLAAISEENAAGTQEASASVQEQADAVQNVSQASTELKGIADHLVTLVDKFIYE